MGVVTLFGFSCLAFGIIMLKLHFIHQRLDNIMEYIASYEKRYGPIETWITEKGRQRRTKASMIFHG